MKLKDILNTTTIHSIEIDGVDYCCDKISINKYLSINIGSNYKPYLFKLDSNIEILDDYTFILQDVEYKQNRICKIKIQKYQKII